MILPRLQLLHLSDSSAAFRFYVGSFPYLLLDMENMDLQPEDVRVPSGDSSPTQVPPDDSLSHQDHTSDLTPPADPALLTSIPRSENQYNEDFTDYARQIHNTTHGAWPVAEPFEEWACRRSHHTRYWFYRAWFHHKTLPWDHEDIEYYKSATGYFIDDHPASHWPSIYSRVWGTRGWQLVLSATQSLSIWTQCEEYEAALRVEEERIAAAQQLNHTPPSRRGQKRQAVDNLEHPSVQYQVEALLQNFSQLDVSKVSMLQGLPVPQQEQLISGLSTPSILTVMNFTKFTNPMILSCTRAAPLQLLRPLLARLLPRTLSAKAPDFLFPYPIQDLCL